jgi:hypothetical protein
MVVQKKHTPILDHLGLVAHFLVFISILILVDGFGDGGFSYLTRCTLPGSTLSLTSFQLSPFALP